MVYFGLVALLIVITPVHRFGLANRQTFWLGGLMPILWLVANGIIANITLYAHQDMLLAVLGTLLLGSSWIAARIDRTEQQLTLTHHKIAAK
ncbi:hypothetical protein C5Z25_04170 [Lactobacillus sp. CBA3605]|uniref:hypothetical protein n=1 Tax=Lactobacillus sp. CBA3605 TaxID=2099788 RepID=UPI000CFB3B7C|nr:hypothetical protein [Lactobacillus sp. CBA3605]AVK61003.1 hypothetical protein C5Z25_04170 [Lactobacillus sp. CBA3605]